MPNRCSWCVTCRACSVHVILCESYVILFFSVCKFGGLLSLVVLYARAVPKRILSCLRNFCEGPDLRSFKHVKTVEPVVINHAFKTITSKMDWDALAVSIWWFLTLSQARQTQILRRPLTRRLAQKYSKANHTFEFASWFFWHVLSVFYRSGVLETRWKRD